MLGNESHQQEEDCNNGDEDASRDPRSVQTRTHAKRGHPTQVILHITPIDEILRGGRLRWFGHVQRRDTDNVTRRVMELAIPGARRRGRSKKTWHHQILDRNEWRGEGHGRPLGDREKAVKVSKVSNHIYY